MSQTAVLDAYRAQLDALATSTDRATQAVLSAWLADRTTEDAAVLAVAAQINKSNAKATALADYYLAQQITAATGDPTPTVGLIAEDSSARLVKAARTTLRLTREAVNHPDTHGGSEDRSTGQLGGRASPSSSIAVAPGDESPVDLVDTLDEVPADPTARLTRLARSEPLEAAQRSTTKGMQKQPEVEGWIRELHTGACELCTWWWREGRVWPAAHPMPTHKGCLCSQRVVLRTRIQPTGKTRNRRNARR